MLCAQQDEGRRGRSPKVLHFQNMRARACVAGCARGGEGCAAPRAAAAVIWGDAEGRLTKRAVFSKQLRRVEHNPWVLATAAFPMLVAAGLATAAPLRDQAPAAIVGAVVLLYVAAVARPGAKLTKVSVEASEEGLRVDGALVPRAEIRAGVVLPKSDKLPTRVRLTRRGVAPNIELCVSDVGTGRELLRALGFDASQSVATFSTMSRAVAHPGMFAGACVSAAALLGVVVMLIGKHTVAVPVALLGAVVIALAMAVVGVIQTKLHVGADGVMARWLWWSRFLRWSEVASFSRYKLKGASTGDEGLSFKMRSGEEVKFPIGSVAWSEDHMAMIEERIREAVDIHERGGAEEGAILLDRGARSIEGWVRHLRSLGEGANAGPRTAPVSRDRLFRIVEDPKAEATARAAAAVALGTSLDDAGRARLDAAASATAAPKLRIAIEAAAKNDEAAMTEALAAMDPEEAKPRARAR